MKPQKGIEVCTQAHTAGLEELCELPKMHNGRLAGKTVVSPPTHDQEAGLDYVPIKRSSLWIVNRSAACHLLSSIL